jgi:hypothetical protein
MRIRVVGFLAAALALAAMCAGVRWGAMVAGGADSYGYVSQAGLWQRGLPIVQQNVVRPSPWPLAAATWAPLGYRPSPKQPDAIVPLYAPGLPLLMASFQVIAGYCGAFLVVPLSGALTIWVTYVLGRRLFDAPGIALWGACLVGTSPIFLYQLMNAMSDVPVTAAWTLALVLTVGRRPFAGGLAMSAAIAIRPNLAPLAVVLLVWILWSGTPSGVLDVAGSPEGAHYVTGTAKAVPYVAPYMTALRFAIGLVPSIVGIAWLNRRLYESMLTSGYGTTADYYSLGYFWTNVRQFATWMANVETPIVALAGLYFVAPRLFPRTKIPLARPLLGGSIVVVVLSYVFYRPFDAWWYLRFLLPMWPVMMVLAAAAITTLARQWFGRICPFVIAVAVAFLAWHGVFTAAKRSVFDLGRGERRYIDVARFIESHTEPEAVILSVQHSGSLRIYANRLTLRYDVLDPAWLDRTLEYLQAIGRRPYFVLDGGEVDAFKQRFGAMNRSGALDWPALATLAPTIFVYDPIDRRPGTAPLMIGGTRGPRRGWCDPPQVWPPLLRMK